MGKDFVIKGMHSMKIVDKDGNPVKGIYDENPILQETKLDIPIIDLIFNHTSVPYEWMDKEPFCNYGHMSGCSFWEEWKWNGKKLNQAPEVDLWKMYGLCNEYWYHEYKFSHHKAEKEFRDYRRSKGEDLDTIYFNNNEVQNFNSEPVKLTIFGDRDEK